jgi:Flp pilus assembly protein TadB
LWGIIIALEFFFLKKYSFIFPLTIQIIRSLGKAAANEAAEKGKQRLQRTLVKSLVQGNLPDAELQQRLHLQRYVFAVVIVVFVVFVVVAAVVAVISIIIIILIINTYSYERALAMRAAQEAKKFSRITREQKTPPKVKFGSVFTAVDSNLMYKPAFTASSC